MVTAVKRSNGVEQAYKAHRSNKYPKAVDKKVQAVALPYFDEMRTAAGATRLGLKTARDYNPSLGPQLTPAIGILGLCSVYTVVKTPVYTYQALKGVQENLKHGDTEGVFFDSIGSVQSVAGGVDALTVSLISLAELTSKVVVPKFLALIFLPLAIASTAVEVVTRGIKSFQTLSLLQELELSKSGNRFRTAKRHFIRLTSKEIYESMKSGKRGMRDAKVFLERKFKLELTNEALEITTLALLALLFTAVAPYVVLGGLALVTLFKVALMVYEKQYLYKGLTQKSNIIKGKTEFLDTN